MTLYGSEVKRLKHKRKIAAVLWGMIIGLAVFSGSQYFVHAEPQAEQFRAPYVAKYYPYKNVSLLSRTGTKTGWNTENGKTFYRPKANFCYADGIANIDNKRYCFDSNGNAVSGWIRVTEKVEWGMHSRCMYFDNTTKEALIGYHRIDGIGRYFNEHGFLASWGFNTYTIDNQVYVDDKAGIVSMVTPMIPLKDAKQAEIPILGEENVIDGDYEFQAQVGEDTVIEPFGFSLEDSQRIYGNAHNFDSIYWCMVPDDSLKGKIGAWYRNAGVYQGRSIDAKFIINDYTMMDLFGKEYGTLGFHKKMIGIAQHNLYDTTCSIEFYDHETQNKVRVKGFATIDDIDSAQACEIISPYDNIYISDKCELLYGSNNGRPVFADDLLNYKLRAENDPSGQVIVNYAGDYFSYKLYTDGSLWKNDLGKRVYAQGNMPCFSEQEVMNDEKEKGVYSWQGYQSTRFARVTTPEPVKNVTDDDENTVKENTLSSLDEEFYYKISHNVPLQQSNYYYSEYKMTDQLEKCLQFVKGKVCDDAGNDVTDLFSVKHTDNIVSFVCKEPDKTGFYGKNYHFLIYVKINKNQDNSAYVQIDEDENEQYVIPNKALLHVESGYENTTLETNTVITIGKILVAKGDLKVYKTDQGTGNTIEGVTFSVYEWNKAAGKYNTDICQTLEYLKDGQYYYNKQKLVRTEENDGRFKIIETKNAEGYTGKWEKELQITCAEGNTEIFEYHVTNTRMLNLKLNKTIYVNEVYEQHGNPIFIFLIQGIDVNGKERYYTRYVTFTPSYINKNKQSDGTVTQSVSIYNVPAGKYTVKEKNVSRYATENVIAVSDNVAVSKKNSGKYYDGIQPIKADVKVDLLTKDGEVTFVNRKITWDKYSHNDISVNQFSVTGS